MTTSDDGEVRPARKLRLGFVGGAPPSFIGRVHRIAARYDDEFDIVGGVFSSDAETNRRAGHALRIPADRTYANVEAMVESEDRRADRMDLVAILTPNTSHFAIARAFVENGFHVLCEKPVTTRTADALALIELQRATGTVFAVAHAYTGYTMVRHARKLIRDGVLGRLRVVQIEYAQGWLATPVERTGDKIARNRTDVGQNGEAGCLAAIGTHAFNLAGYVTGLEIDAVAANVGTVVKGRGVPDNAHLLLRYQDAVTGSMWVSQIAAGHANALRVRVVGELGSLEWSHDDPERLALQRLGGATEILRRGGAYLCGPLRAPAGHPEGFTDAFANLYAGVAPLIRGAERGAAPEHADFPIPNLIDGARAVRFADAALESSADGGAWTDARLHFPRVG